MNQTQTDNHQQHIGRLDVEVFTEAINVGKGDITDTQTNHRIDGKVVKLDRIKSSVDQSHTVTQRKRGNVFGDIAETGQEKDDPEHERQVIVTGQHMRGSEPHITQITAFYNGQFIGLGHAVRVDHL